jgi:hypothetical protein
VSSDRVLKSMFRKWRTLNLLLMLLLCPGASSSARADPSQATLVARLHHEIEVDQAEVGLLHERLVKDYIQMFPAPWRAQPYPRNPAAPSFEITNLETWWDSDPRPPGLTPVFRFRLHNSGSKPITDMSLTYTYYLASGTKIGSSNDQLVPNIVQAIASGQWITVTARRDATSRPLFSPMMVQAEIDFSAHESTLFLRRITIPPKPQRLPSDEALR